MPERVAITVLTYNSARHVTACVESVLAQTYDNIELAVVDNASRDGTAELVEETFPDVRVHRNKSNLGFARAHNRMIATTDAPFYMPLNPDCRLAESFVARLVAGADDFGYVTGKILFDLVEPSPRIYSTGHLLCADGTVANRGYGQIDRGEYDRPETVWGANGAAPLYRTEMLKHLALSRGVFFDEVFFVYGEDIDLDWRAHRDGFACGYVPEAIAYHVSEGSAGFKQQRIRRQYLRNAHLARIMNAPSGAFLRRMFLPMLIELGRYSLGDPLGALANLIEEAALIPHIVRRRCR